MNLLLSWLSVDDVTLKPNILARFHNNLDVCIILYVCSSIRDPV